MIIAAAEIYKRQNKVIHRGFSDLGLTYENSKEDMVTLFSDIANRAVAGISQMTLGERDELIRQLTKKGCNLFRPAVPKGARDWKKGDRELKISCGRPAGVPAEKRPMIEKIGAILADMKLPWTYADGIARKRFKVQAVEWCRVDQIEKIMQMLIVYQRRHGGGQ